VVNGACRVYRGDSTYRADMKTRVSVFNAINKSGLVCVCAHAAFISKDAGPAHAMLYTLPMRCYSYRVNFDGGGAKMSREKWDS